MSEQQPSDVIDVNYVANLARLRLTDEEARTFQGQLDQVLKHVRLLAELDVEGVEPTAHATPLTNVLREDVAGISLDRSVVMDNAPAERDGQFLVPKIIE